MGWHEGKGSKSQQNCDQGYIQNMDVVKELPTGHYGGQIPQIVSGNMLRCQCALLRPGLPPSRGGGEVCVCDDKPSGLIKNSPGAEGVSSSAGR